MKTADKYIGTKDFYKKVLNVSIPIMVQNGITNFVGLLDNIMVGQVGTEQMSGIAIVNQLLLVFNLAVFGAISGAGIFTAQFYGNEDHKGVRYTFRFKMYICVIITLLSIFILGLFGEELISMYLKGEESGLSMDQALKYGKQYMWIMFIGLLPFAIEQAYSGTLRECGETVVSMKAGVAAILVNVFLNYVLIFGKFGAPSLGVAGAAIATVISRYIQAVIVIVWTHRHKKRMPFINGAYKSPFIPLKLTKKIILRGTPLTVNEIMWSLGIAMMNQCYSIRGLDAVAAMNISSTISNLFNVAFVAMGDAIAIIVGQLLGAGKYKEAMDTDRKLIFFSVMMCLVLGTILFLTAPLFPMLYNTTEGVKKLAASFIKVAAVFTPAWGFMHAAYFTLRSGGKTLITFLFDSVYLWAVAFPTAFILSRYTDMYVIYMYFCVSAVDIIKCVIGFILVKKGVWLNNIVRD